MANFAPRLATSCCLWLGWRGNRNCPEGKALGEASSGCRFFLATERPYIGASPEPQATGVATSCSLSTGEAHTSQSHVTGFVSTSAPKLCARTSAPKWLTAAPDWCKAQAAEAVPDGGGARGAASRVSHEVAQVACACACPRGGLSTRWLLADCFGLLHPQTRPRFAHGLPTRWRRWLAHAIGETLQRAACGSQNAHGCPENRFSAAFHLGLRLPYQRGVFVALWAILASGLNPHENPRHGTKCCAAWLPYPLVRFVAPRGIPRAC